MYPALVAISIAYGVVYINLDARVDRRTALRGELRAAPCELKMLATLVLGIGVAGLDQEQHLPAGSEMPDYPIDLFVTWAGPGGNNVRSRYNGELPVLLSTVDAYAPWFRFIWVAVNPEVLATSVAKSLAKAHSRVRFVDRCAFLPRQSCPTSNGFVVAANSYRLPKLSNHYIITDDDIFLGRAVEPSTFFVDGKPRVWQTTPTWGEFAGQKFHTMYKDTRVFTGLLPRSSCPCPHLWYPQLRSEVEAVANAFPAYHAFMSSHKYRFSSTGDPGRQGQDEDPIGVMNWWYVTHKLSAVKLIMPHRYTWWDETELTPRGVSTALRKRPIFINVNDHFSADATVLAMQRLMFNRLSAGIVVATPPPRTAPAILFVHARKTGGTTVLDMLERVARKVVVCAENWRVDPTAANDTQVAFSVNQEWDSFELKQPCHKCMVSIGREPKSRVLSLYLHRLRRRQIAPTMSIATYLTSTTATGVHRDDHYHGFYSWAQQWCGRAHRCTRFASQSPWILATAKRHVMQHCGVIGVVERFDAFVAAGVAAFPQFFGDGSYAIANKAESTNRTKLSLAVVAKLYPPILLALETEFYNWAKNWSRSQPTAAVATASASWSPKKQFWNGGAIPWKSASNYKQASYDTPDASFKQPDLF
jgi:hypothetical protein